MPLTITRTSVLAIIALQTGFIQTFPNTVFGQTSENPETTKSNQNQSPFDFNIPAQPLYEALSLLSRQSGVAITILSTVPADLRGQAVRGRMDVDNAMKRLLGPHSVPYRLTDGALVVGQAEDGAQALPAITVNAPVPNLTLSGEGGDSGLNVFNREAIKTITTADKDPMRLLRVLPNVNFDNDQFKVGQSGGTGTLSEQDLTPDRVSISGGKVYENKVMLDGQDNTTAFDVTNTNEADADKIGIHNPMALFANTDLLEQVAVYDSNVPVRYGGFTGGVIDMRTRAPADHFGGSVGYMRQFDQWVHYRNDYDGATSGLDAPRFKKDNYDLSVDVPVSPRLRTLVAASRQEAESKRIPTDNYADGSKSETQSTSSSYLGSVSADLGERTTLGFRGLYAPYTQEYTRANMADDQLETSGDKYQFNADLKFTGKHMTADLMAGYSKSGYERDAPDVAYTWRRAGTKADTCAGGTSCVEGGYGDIADKQTDTQIKGELGTTALGVDWSAGADYHQTEARRVRDSTAIHYFNPTLATQTVVCASASDPSCIAGDQAARSRNVYLARDYSAEVANLGSWLQGEKKVDFDHSWFRGLDLRGGLRADYSDFKDNFDWAPRASATLRLPAEIGLTVGAARYYSTDTLTYALYAQAPNVLTQTRGRVVGTTWTSTDWSAATPRYQYVDADLRTPYSDERTAALSFPMLWGGGRLKYVDRRNRDEIAMLSYTENSVAKRKPTNDGWTNYQSVSLEWTKNLANHAFLVNASWSDTERNATSYLESPDDTDTTRIYYNGSVVTRANLPLLADNFAQPVTLNATWTSKWLEDALTVNLTGKYRYKREEIAATDNSIVVGGSSYTIYEKVTRNPLVRFDLSASYQVPTLDGQHLELQAFVENLFGARSQTADSTAPYERGRAFWFGARYHF